MQYRTYPDWFMARQRYETAECAFVPEAA